MFTNKELMKEDEELTENIKSSFMYGLKSENSKIRSSFHDALNDSIGQTIYDRLSYIFESNNWENLSDNFWIKHGLDLILSVVNFDDQIDVSEKMSKICSITKSIPEDSNDTKMNKKLTKELFKSITQLPSKI
jgi:hypothetical protein